MPRACAGEHVANPHAFHPNPPVTLAISSNAHVVADLSSAVSAVMGPIINAGSTDYETDEAAAAAVRAVNFRLH
jgi:hypothetical protein